MNKINEIIKSRDLKKFIIQFIKFCVVGVSNTLINYAVYYIFIAINPSLYIVGFSLGFVISTANAYFWNHKFVFKKMESGHIRVILRTFIAYGATFLLSTVMLSFWAETVGLSKWLAVIPVTMVTIPINFLVNKFWTFRKIEEGAALSGKRCIVELLGFLAPIAFVCGAFLFGFNKNSIYPFGEGTLETGDLAQLFVPMYYRVWDALRGGVPMFFDWKTGGGLNIAEPNAIFSLYSPFNVFFYYIEREQIFHMMSIFTMIKCAVATATMYGFLRCCVKSSMFWSGVLAASYSLSGYIVLFYTNSQWPDAVAVFPLVIWGLVYMFKKRGRKFSVLPYILALALLVFINYYIAFMSLIFIFLLGGLYIIMFIPQSEEICGVGVRRVRAVTIIKFGLSTLTSLLLVMPTLLPALLQMMGSSRMSINGKTETLLDKINKYVIDPLNYWDQDKYLMLLGSGIGLFLLIMALVESRKNHALKRPLAFAWIAVAATTLPIILENTNVMLHGGSYALFPMRYGFLVSFAFLTAGGYFSTKLKATTRPFTLLNLISKPRPPVVFGEECETIDEEKITSLSDTEEINCALEHNRIAKKLKKKKKMQAFLRFLLKKTLLCTALLVVVGIGAAIFIFGTQKLLEVFVQVKDEKKSFDQLFKLWLITELCAVGSYIIITISKINYRFLAVPLAAVLVCFTYAYVPLTFNQNEAGQVFIFRSDELRENGLVYNSNTDRVHSIGETLHSNFAFITQQASLANWTHSASSEYQGSLENLGYSRIWTRLESSGGTLFSDLILGVTHTHSVKDISAPIFEQVGEALESGHRIYKNVYSLPFGFVINGSLFNVEYPGDDDGRSREIKRMSYQNDVYRAMTGKDEDIMEVIPSTTIKSGSTYTINISGRKALYFFDGKSGITIRVNGEIFELPSVYNYDSSSYTNYFNNNIIYLGYFEDETVTITLSNSSTSAVFGSLDIDKLEALTNEYTDDFTRVIGGEEGNRATMSYKINANNGDNLFIPVHYDEGWSATVNGRRVIIKGTVGEMMQVPLDEGENVVELTFTPKGLHAGILLSAVALFAIALYAFLITNKRIVAYFTDGAKYVPDWVFCSAAFVVESVFILALGTTFLLLYIAPALFTTIFRFMKLR